MKKKMIIFQLTVFIILGLGAFAWTMESGSAPFVYETVVEGIRGEFQIMSLASMNMKDPNGATHHVMIKFYEDNLNRQIKETTGKVVVISPSKNEKSGELKNYNGIFAANVTFDESGNYMVMCTVKLEGKEIQYRFTYPRS